MKRCVAGLVVMALAGLGGLAWGAAVAPDADCRIVRRSVDGVAEITLENGLVRLCFVPSRGGVCTSFSPPS